MANYISKINGADISASYALSSSYAVTATNATNATTATDATNAQTALYATSISSSTNIPLTYSALFRSINPVSNVPFSTDNILNIANGIFTIGTGITTKTENLEVTNQSILLGTNTNILLGPSSSIQGNRVLLTGSNVILDATSGSTYFVTSSAVPTGVPTQLVGPSPINRAAVQFAKSGSGDNYLIYVYIGGRWRSASLA